MTLTSETLLSESLADPIEPWDVNAFARLEELRTRDDAAYRALINRTLDYLRERALPRGSRILDVGTGLGFLARAVSDEGYEVTGIDPAEGNIRLARTVHAGAQSLGFVASDLHQYAERHPDLRFDSIIANMTLHCVEFLQAFMVSAETMLAQGGFMFVTIPNPRTYLQSRSDIDVTAIDLSVEQRLEIPFRIRAHEPHPSRVVYFHRPLWLYLHIIRSAKLSVIDFDIPHRVGPGRERDIAVLVLERR